MVIAQGLLVNYYNQYTLEAAYQGMKMNGTYEFPNAIYIDGIDEAGLLRTGPGQICGPGADCKTELPMPPASTPRATAAYAYAATVVASNYIKLCRDRYGHCWTASQLSSPSYPNKFRRLFCASCYDWHDSTSLLLRYAGATLGHALRT